MIITNDNVLLSQGLVEWYDPIEDVKKQITVEAARRLAQVNSDMKQKLIDLNALDGATEL